MEWMNEMDAEMKDMFGLVLNGIDGLEQRMGGLEQRMDRMESEVSELGSKVTRIEETSRVLQEDMLAVKITLENDVSRKINSLYEGFTMSIEQQQELRKRADNIEQRAERLEVLAGAGLF